MFGFWISGLSLLRVLLGWLVRVRWRLFGLCVLTRLALVCVLLVSFVAWSGIGLGVGLNVVT